MSSTGLPPPHCWFTDDGWTAERLVDHSRLLHLFIQALINLLLSIHVLCAQLCYQQGQRPFSWKDLQIRDFIQVPSPARDKPSSSNRRMVWAGSAYLQPKNSWRSWPTSQEGGSHIPEYRQVPSSPHFHVWRQDFWDMSSPPDTEHD